MTTVDWLGILHPALAVVIIYPLIGMVVRLAIQTRARRLQTLKCPPTVGREHSDLGRWLAVGVVVEVRAVVCEAIPAAQRPQRCKRDQ